MFFLVQMAKNADGTYTQGTSAYETMNEAVQAFHTAFASAMTKDYLKFTADILTEDGLVQKSEVYEASTDDADVPTE